MLRVTVFLGFAIALATFAPGTGNPNGSGAQAGPYVVKDASRD